jgi:hypothetical protein
VFAPDPITPTLRLLTSSVIASRASSAVSVTFRSRDGSAAVDRFVDRHPHGIRRDECHS